MSFSLSWSWRSLRLSGPSSLCTSTATAITIHHLNVHACRLDAYHRQHGFPLGVRPEMEDAMGTARFIFFYLVGGVVAMTARSSVIPFPIPCLGASGAIAAVMGAFIITFPRDRIRTCRLLPHFHPHHFYSGCAADWLLVSHADAQLRHRRHSSHWRRGLPCSHRGLSLRSCDCAFPRPTRWTGQLHSPLSRISRSRVSVWQLRAASPLLLSQHFGRCECNRECRCRHRHCRQVADRAVLLDAP